MTEPRRREDIEMPRQQRSRRPSASMLVAFLALLISLGGTGYAAIKLPRNSVGAKQIKPNAVTGTKVRDASLFRNDFAPNQLPTGPQGPRGPQGKPGPTGLRGPSDARIVHPSTDTLSNAPSVPVQIGSLPGLAAGNYLVRFTGVAVYRETGKRMIVVCQTRVNGDIVKETIAIVGETAGASGAVGLSSEVAVTLSSPASIAETCYPDSPSAPGQNPKVGYHSLSATRVDKVTTD